MSTVIWTRIFGSTGWDVPYAMTTGSDGAIYVAGYLGGNFDGQIINGTSGGFFTKYDPDGSRLWTKFVGTSGQAEVYALAPGSDGSIYVSGAIQGSGYLASAAFVTKYDTDGDILWNNVLDSSGNEIPEGLTIGADGSVYVAGFTSSNILDGQIRKGRTDAFITKYSVDGAKLWTKLFGSTGNDYGSQLTTGADGAIYLVGSTGNDAFIACFDADGSNVWTRVFGGAGLDTAYAVTTGRDGAIYVAGITQDASSFDGETKPGWGHDAFITKFNTDGNKAWTKILGTADNIDFANGLTVGIDGAIYVAGHTKGNLDGEINLGGNDVFITRYNADGSKEWTKLLGGGSRDWAKGLTTGKDGSIYVAGYTNASLNGQVAIGARDVFLAKLSVPISGPIITASSLSIAENSVAGTLVGTLIASDPGGNLLTYGITSGNTDVDADGNATFAIDAASGVITVNDADDLNFEVTKTFNLTVQASNGSLASSAIVTVSLTDINEAIYSDSSYILQADEFNLVLTGSSAINGTGNALDNRITGNAGNNILSGMAGADVLVGGAGKDTLDGGLGEDTADYSDQTADVSIALGGRTPWISVRIGNQVEDRLKNIEHLIGGSGNDSLTGDGKANRLEGGLGNDSLDGGAGEDTLVGGAGDDTYTIDNAGDVIIESSGEGTDLIRTTLRQIDLIDYDHVENLIYTGRSNSTLIGSDIDNVIRGGSGNDIIEGGAGSDTLYGGDGADLFRGYYFYDDAEINGGDPAFSEAAFQYEKENSVDRLYGGRGNDFYVFDGFVNTPEVIEYRDEGTDTIYGGRGPYMPDNVENYINDTSLTDDNGNYLYVEIIGNHLNNVIRSDVNFDLMPETAGLDWVATNIKRLLDSTDDFESNEKFFGMAGNDTLLGGAGDDYLSGGEGRDKLTGGTGEDQFVFDAALNRRTNVDAITDFIRGQDKIVLDSKVFSKFTMDEDVADHFSATTRALDIDDYLVYNASNKTLFYDADGNGSGAAVAFAVLTGVNTLSHHDFLII